MPSAADTEETLTVRVEDSQGHFFGEATVPASVDRPSMGGTRIMLLPRFMDFPDHPLHLQDIQTLAHFGVDDFGFLNIQWEIRLVPRGGVVLSSESLQAPRVPLPVGLAIRAKWEPSKLFENSKMPTNNVVSVEFSDGQRFNIDQSNPLFVGLSKPELLEKVTFICASQEGNHGSICVSHISLPLPPFTNEFLERDHRYCCPIFADDVEETLGLLFVSMRALPKPVDGGLLPCKDGARCPNINDPIHQVSASHPVADWGHPLPDCPHGAFQQIMWESELHIARATERRWKKECMKEARPTEQHLRHLLEVLLGRLPLDPHLGQLASSFFNKAPTTLKGSEVQQLLIAACFHTETISVTDACRFAFVALRREAERAVRIADIVSILENSLLGRSIDMNVREIERRVTDVFGRSLEAFVSFDDFLKLFATNPCFWFDLGIPINFSKNTFSSAPLTVPSSTGLSRQTGNTDGDPNWKTFVVRVIKTGRAFSVTSHANDVVIDVMQMIEESCGVPSSRQRWVIQGLAVDSRRLIGDVLPKTGSGIEISIQEKEETIKLVIVHREKNRKWEHHFAASDKVLKLRAFVQQKTMIPLSRCILSSCSQLMQDRHSLDHYKLIEGSIIEVSHQ